MDVPILTLTDGSYTAYTIGNHHMNSPLDPKNTVRGRRVCTFEVPEEFHGPFVFASYYAWRQWALDGKALEKLFARIKNLTGKNCVVSEKSEAPNGNEFYGQNVAYSFAIENTTITFEIDSIVCHIKASVLPSYIGDGNFDEEKWQKCAAEVTTLINALGFKILDK
jgi:hypothetical protein